MNPCPLRESSIERTSNLATPSQRQFRGSTALDDLREHRTLSNRAKKRSFRKLLTGCVVLVAGATRGAGRGIARAFGEAGATVYCTGRTGTDFEIQWLTTLAARTRKFKGRIPA